MGRKKKKTAITYDEQMIIIAKDMISGKYGNGLNIKNSINSLGYGNIYPSVKKCAKLIKTGQLL